MKKLLLFLAIVICSYAQTFPAQCPNGPVIGVPAIGGGIKFACLTIGQVTVTSGSPAVVLQRTEIGYTINFAFPLPTVVTPPPSTGGALPNSVKCATLGGQIGLLVFSDGQGNCWVPSMIKDSTGAVTTAKLISTDDANATVVLARVNATMMATVFLR